MRETETLSRPRDFFFQGASAPCEKKIEEAEAVGRAAAASVTTLMRETETLSRPLAMLWLKIFLSP